MKFRSKPITVDAVTVDELIYQAASDWKALPEWIREIYDSKAQNMCVVFSPDSVFLWAADVEFRAVLGDWILRTDEGMISRCRSELFEQMYEPARSE
jgi:hypothetical protein